jgi:ribosomal protein S12 methylthiotransferase
VTPIRDTGPLPPEPLRPAVCFLTLGCPKNESDTDRMAASLSSNYILVPEPEDADVVVVNTCSFIQGATEESIATVLGLAEWRAGADKRRLVVAGCMPSRYGAELTRELPEVDAFVPVADESTLAEVLRDLTGVAVGLPCFERLDAGPSAYLQVSDGCHRACTYCTIPAIRGDYVSRPADEIVAEAQVLIGNGVREIVLVGQDVSAWGHDLTDDIELFAETDLAGLVRRLARLEGIGWLRLLYVQPDGVTPELLEVMAAEPAVCHYLDIPFQHAASGVLHRMGRKGSGGEYLRLLGVIRSFVPDICLRTTLIAGFPGETDADVEALLAFLDDAQLDYVGVFPFSPEEGTRAAELPYQIGDRERVARAQRIRDAADIIGFDRAAAYVGRTLEVLVEGTDEDGTTVGRHRGQAPEVDGVVLLDKPVAPGEIVEAAIVDSLGYDLVGETEGS